MSFPSSRPDRAAVALSLAAIDNFYRSRGAGRPEVAREELAQTAPRAPTEAEQLNSPCRTALDEWFAARTKQLAAREQAGSDGEAQPSAVWLSRSGTRMSTRAIDLVIRRLAAEAALELSAHVLRHTCVTT